jgi:hypothetical protein
VTTEAVHPSTGKLADTGVGWWAWPVTLLIAVAVCLVGVVALQRQPPPPPTRATQPAARHAPPRVTAPPVVPSGSTVLAQVLTIDHQYGGIGLRIAGQRYELHLSPSTVFPAPCLQRDDLRPGMLVAAVLPWYLSGNVYLTAVSPVMPCTAAATPGTTVRSLAPDLGDSPPRSRAP